jgi:hypothetical protein
VRGVEQRADLGEPVVVQQGDRAADPVDLGDDVAGAGEQVGVQRGEVVDRRVAQAGPAEHGRRLLHGRPPGAVLAAGMAVADLRVDHQQREADVRRGERDLPCGVVVGVEQQRVAGRAEQRRRLVHPAGLGTDHVVLRAAAGVDQQLPALRRTAEAEPVQVVDGQRGRALQRGGRRQPRAERHRVGDQQVDPADRVPGGAQCPQHPGDVACPPLGTARPDVGEVAVVAALLGKAAQPQPLVVALGDLDDGALRDREGQAQPVGVVDVLADQVHPPRGGPAAVRLALEQLRERGHESSSPTLVGRVRGTGVSVGSPARSLTVRPPAAAGPSVPVARR